jgi:sulfotransferase
MKKKYHFLAGLPRSGNTLLSAILNQNPDIYSSPLSPLSTTMFETWQGFKTEHNFRNDENRKRTTKLISSMPDTFYNDIEKPIIFDREKAWGTPENLSIIRNYITPNPKILFTVRSITEILASFINMDATYIKNGAYEAGLYKANYLNKNDLICEYLMSPGRDIDKGLLSLSSAFMPWNIGVFHIIEYNDLVLKPEETMAKVYEFLELDNYKHNFSKIIKVETDNDEVIGLPYNLHNVRKSISKSSTSTDVLSDYIKHKYANVEFWRDNSLLKIGE